MISQRLDEGKYQEAAELLFDPKVQHENRNRREFWYAQILVAALLDRGFHIAFHTGKIALLGRIDVAAMLNYFKKYAKHEAYAAHRDTIHDLIAYYENWDKNNQPKPETNKQETAHRETLTVSLPEKLFR
jgi:hypothetical protein